MSDNALNSNATPDGDTCEQNHSALPSNISSTVTNSPVPAVIGLLALVVFMFVAVFADRNSSESSHSDRVANAPSDVMLDDELKASASSNHVIEEDKAVTEEADVDSRATTPTPGSKTNLSLATSYPKSVTSVCETFLTLVMATCKCLAILIVALFVMYDLVKAARAKMIRSLVFLTMGLCLWLSCEMVLIRTVGIIVMAVAFLTISHHLHTRRFRGAAFILGLSLGLLAFGCSVIGTLNRIERGAVREGQIEAASVAVYEATQALMMNMAPHDPTEDPEPKAIPLTEAAASADAGSNNDTKATAKTLLDSASTETSGRNATTSLIGESRAGVQIEPSIERNCFTAARIFATLLALFIAYQILTHYARNAMYRARMSWLWLKAIFGQPEASLVCGIGHVGLRLIRELRRNGQQVIAMEKNEDHANLKAAIATDAIVLNGDATLLESLHELPLIAIKTIYVLCGDDSVNLEAAMNVKRIFNPKPNHSDRREWSITTWIQDQAQRIVDQRMSNNRECFVQIFDSEMQKVLHHKFHSKTAKKSELRFRPFNVDLNAVRNLITDELALLRPKAVDEVALYVVIGFDSRWEEVVLGLAQLAHFENYGRSRILVLTEDPEQDSKAFIARYPRLTIDRPACGKIADVNFCSLTDEWPSTFAGAAKGRTEATYVHVDEQGVSHFDTLDLVANGSGASSFVRCLVSLTSKENRASDFEGYNTHNVRIRSASEVAVEQLKKANQIDDAGEATSWFEVEGPEAGVRAFLASNELKKEKAFKALQWGLEFATQTLFSTLPIVPGDDEFMLQLHRLINEPQWQIVTGGATDAASTLPPWARRVRPVMIIAGGDDNKNFTWSNSFAHYWERFRGRHSVKPPAVIGHGEQTPLIDITDMPVYVWISDQEPLRELLDRTEDGLTGSPNSTRSGAAASEDPPASSKNSSDDPKTESSNCEDTGVIQDGCRSFGDPRKTAGRIAIHESFRRYLSRGASDAYNHVTSILPPPPKATSNSNRKTEAIAVPPLKADPEHYDSQQSNNHAADHAIIKLAMLHEAASWADRWKEITVRNRELERAGELKDLMGKEALLAGATLEIPMPDGSLGRITRDDAQLQVIAEAEHYRWSAELLLRNASWHPTELAKIPLESGPEKVRAPEAIHIRKTLCPWNQLGKDEHEQRKDIEQVWFMLHAFDKPKQ